MGRGVGRGRGEIQRAFDPVLDKIFVMVQEQEAAVTRKKGHGPKVSTG